MNAPIFAKGDRIRSKRCPRDEMTVTFTDGKTVRVKHGLSSSELGDPGEYELVPDMTLFGEPT